MNDQPGIFIKRNGDIFVYNELWPGRTEKTKAITLKDKFLALFYIIKWVIFHK